MVKTFAISQLILPASILPLPENIIQRVNKILFRFIWKGKDKIKRRKTYQDTKRGGLKMIDVKSHFEALKANWANRFISNTDKAACWIQIPTLYFKRLSMDITELRYNFDESVVFHDSKRIPMFYQEVLNYYNKAHCTDLKTFQTNIRNECIWANKYITAITRKKKTTLYLRNWIRSGVRYVSDLRFKSGVLDERYVYNLIQDKRNIYTEVLTVKNALLPYKDKLRENNTCNVHSDNSDLLTTKQLYTKLLYKSSSDDLDIEEPSLFLSANFNNFNQLDAFHCKIFQEKEIKLKEFNFKMLHGILPCNSNLYKWNLKDTDICDVCNSPQTIRHLLHDCKYVHVLWQKAGSYFDIDITFEMIAGSQRRCQYNNILTIISFLIYKDWLTLSVEGLKRCYPINLNKFKAELLLRARIYRNCKKFTETTILLVELFADFLA